MHANIEHESPMANAQQHAAAADFLPCSKRRDGYHFPTRPPSTYVAELDVLLAAGYATHTPAQPFPPPPSSLHRIRTLLPQPPAMEAAHPSRYCFLF